MGGALLDGLSAVVTMFTQMIQLLVIASIIVSWVGDRSNPIVQMIYNITEPIFRPIRRLTSKIPGPFDWAPMVVLAIVILIQKVMEAILRGYARGMG
jgi:YggT family protein